MLDDESIRDIVRTLEDFSRAQREIGSRLAREVDLPRAGVGILRYLSVSGPVSIGCVAQVLRVDLSVASRHLTVLVKDGLVRRTVDDEDRRARMIELTELGHERVAELRTHMTALLNAVFADWDPVELRAATSQVSRLGQAIAALGDTLPVENPTDGPARKKSMKEDQ